MLSLKDRYFRFYMKSCESCGVKIPDDYVNLLCLECYQVQTVKEENKESIEGQGILDPAYVENEEAEDKEQWVANVKTFEKNGQLLWYPTRNMYEFIKTYCMGKITQHPQYPKYIWKPQIVDVGCGIGLGSNILSLEADFVWGIDKNENSVRFAQQAFTREKNGIYYSSQLTFDRIDIMEDTRDFMKFDIVVAIEVIEHIKDARGFMDKLVKLAKKDGEFFISTPNRNNKHIAKERPKNKYHVREWTMEEFVAFLDPYVKKIEVLNSNGEFVGDKKDHTPLLAHCYL